MKRNKLKLFSLVLPLVSASAFATPFAIDEFTITRNGSLFFQDTFDNGNPNDTGFIFNNGNPAVYETVPNPLAGVEANGRLSLDPTQGQLVNSALTGNPILSHRARLVSNTSNNPANLNRGLKVDDTFSITGLFDLVIPSIIGERVSIRLTDRGTVNGTGDDVVEVDLRRRSNGSVFVEFREQDVVNSTNIIFDAIELTAAALGLTEQEFGMYEQIAFNLNRNDVNGGISAAFQLLDIDGVLNAFNYDFGGSATIFEGELFTRAEFLSIINLAQAGVSEPATLLLMLLGLFLLVVATRQASADNKWERRRQRDA